MRPYYDHAGITIYHGDCREVLPALQQATALLMDPPYGIAYKSGWPRMQGNARSIANDDDMAIRDWVLRWWGGGPALVFGSWRRPRPSDTRGVLIWDKGGALGMGDLSLPWKFDHEEIYVLGAGFVGRRDSGSVIGCPPEQSMGRAHPHQKPVRLLKRLIAKLPGAILDPCAGVGSSLIAAKEMLRPAIGIETEERYCEIAAKRLAQGMLFEPGIAAEPPSVALPEALP